MSEWKKPWVYNPKTAEDRIAKLEEEIRQLKEENTNLKIHVRILEEDRRNDKGIRR